MDITQEYAITIGGIFLVLILANLQPLVVQVVEYISVFLSQQLKYPYLIRRHRLIGLWS